MRLDDLSRALRAELDSQRVGTPVSMRVHLAWPDADADLEAALETMLALARSVFGSEASRVSRSTRADRRQITALCAFERGQSALFSLARGCGSRPVFELLVVGNRGVIRLEGGEELRELA
jgi:hypothetical protein